ncbi:hypothetical protein P171DRAFT_489786 [Karstenula rhodostoma CBS 690.94]|uniref:Uncharacterized protein n=1 Tax=Karstenula rhodostoma CBS 690.94 TaxID=1392251 RepID=A0A9P4P9Q7_9PLEO|nr:hypothetical protein P171DRAFT_489786 [Karstenula rhodostoma CBS 690.94]
MLVPEFKIKAFAAGVRAAWTPLPGIALRFGILIPLGLYQQHAKTHWKAIEDYPKLGDVYSLDARSGESMAMKWGQRNFYYHLAVLIPSIFLLPPANIIFAIPDIVLLAYLGLTVTHQGHYSPKNMDACKDPALLSNTAFLQAAANLGLLANAERACIQFVQQRNLAVVVCALVASMIFFNICNCFFACLSLAKEVTLSRLPYSQLPFWNNILPTLMLPFRDFGVLCFWILCYVPCLVFRRLPESFQARILFAIRCSSKSIQARFRQRSSAQGARDDHSGTWTHVLREKSPVTPLAEFLGVYDVLVMVATHLHYNDIVNLSLVSRSICQTLLPAPDSAQQPLHLGAYTCDPVTRAQCWACLNQICKGCSFRRVLKEAQLFCDHMLHCLPHCSACYRRTLREPRLEASRQIDTRRCGCRHPTTSSTSRFFQRLFHGGENRARGVSDVASPRGGPLLICRSCNQLSDAELVEDSMRRLECEMSQATTVSNVKGIADSICCSNCRKVLGEGRRWWVCEFCDKECRSGLHGA